jgi:two-component system heavy metal sensor histidine kinase CusS
VSASAVSLTRRLSLQLAWQIAAGLALLCAGVFAATAWSFSDKQRAHLTVKLAASKDSAIVADRLGGPAEVRRQLGGSLPRRPGTFIELRSADGQLLYRDAVAPDPSHAISLPFEVPLSAGVARGTMWLDKADDDRMLRRLALTLVAASALGGLLAGVASAWRVRRTLRPLSELANQTRAITPGRMDQRLALSEPILELQPWIDQFNALLGRLESAYVQLEAFNADVAHELRTPLAALMGHTEVALSRERTPQALRETLAANLEELQRLSTLVNDMLFLSCADRGARARRGAPVSLRELVAQVIEFHDAPLSEAQLRVYVEGDVQAAVDEPLFKRAVSNLLGNATRHAVTGSAILVHIGCDAGGQVEVVVENAGPDIEPSHLPRLFDRFFRADEARADAQLHHGLGLAIVAAIARMHAGTTMALSGGGRTRIGFALAAA